MSIIHQMILKKNQKAGAQFRPINQEAQRELSETMNLMTSHPQEYLLHFLHAMERITDSIFEETSKETYDYILYDAQSLPGKWVAYFYGNHN